MGSYKVSGENNSFSVSLPYEKQVISTTVQTGKDIFHEHKLGLILEAHERAINGEVPNVTDDAKLIIAMGKDIHLVEGSKLNFKITTFDDLMMLKALLKIGRTEVK